MKVGDTAPVNLAGHVVAQAKIVNMEDGIATLEFPATRVQMSYVTQLAPEVEQVREESGTQTIVTGIDRVDGDGNIIDSTNAVPVQPGESAPVAVESANGTLSVNQEGTVAATVNGESATPVGEATQTELVEPVMNEAVATSE